MISKVIKVKSSSAFNIKTLNEYLRLGHKDDPKLESERVINSFTLNMFSDDIETATQEMMYTASLNTRSKCSKYMHLVLSLSEGEKLSEEQWKKIIKDYVKEVGMSEHQVIAVHHNDNGKEHYHLVINRIDTEKHTRVNDYNLFYKLQKFDEEIEKKYNLKQFNHKSDQKVDYQRSALNKAKKIEIKSEHQTLLTYLLEHKEEIKKATTSWKELQEKLAEFDCSIKVKGRGLVFFSLNSEHPAETKASSFDRDFSYSKLIKKLGVLPSNFNLSTKLEDAQNKHQNRNYQTTFENKPLTKNAKRIEYTAYFFKKIAEREDKVLDRGDRLLVKKAEDYKTYQDLLKIAKKRFGNGNITIKGNRNFQQRMMFHALKLNIKIKLSDSLLEREYEAKLRVKLQANIKRSHLTQAQEKQRKAEYEQQTRRDQQHSNIRRDQSEKIRTSHHHF